MTNKKTTTMTLNEYQKQAMTTCMDTCQNFSYMFTNLVGEVGELASKVAKAVRKGQISIDYNELNPIQMSKEEENAFDEGLMLEAGDVLWQLAGLCNYMGWTLQDVAHANLDKLASRKQRGVIDGSGDNR